MPAGPIAIEHLARAVEMFTTRTTLKLDEIAESIQKLDANQRLMLHEFSSLARRVADHEVRITEIETKMRSPSGELEARAAARSKKVRARSK